MPRLTARTRLLLAVLALSTVVGVVAAKYNARGDLHVAAATAHVMVDDPDASIVDRQALPQDVSSLQKRAELFSRLLVTEPVLEAVGRRLGVPGDQISGLARTTDNVPIPLTEPGSEERADQIRDSHAPYRLELQSEPGEPIFSIYAEAPSVDGAHRLADAAVLGLGDYLRSLARSQGVSERVMPRLRQLGQARGGLTNRRGPMVVAGLTFIVAFGLTFVGLLALAHRYRRRAGIGTATPAPPEAVDQGDDGGDWPHTTRLLPWAVAGFIAMLWLTPFDKLQLAMSTPIDMKLDRLVLPFVIALWLLAFAAGGRLAPKLRLTPIHIAIGAFLAIAFLSVVFDARYLNQTGELSLAMKKVPLLLTYVSVFVIVASAVRRTEVPAFMTYTLVLAVICALGIIYEYRFKVNLFNDWSQKLLPHGLFRFVADTDGVAVDSIGRRWVVGPTGFGVEAVGMLSMALPIAILRLVGETTPRQRVLYGLSIAILFAGVFATDRKSALLGPIAVILTLAYFRRRELLSLAPMGLAIALTVAVLSPGAVHGVISQFTRADRSNVATVSDRTSDYDAVRPDLWTHLLFGRGFGTYRPDAYRILDSEILNRTVETGIVGLLGFLFIGISVILAARRTVSERDPRWAPAALWGISAAVCFLVLAVLFDELGFPHGTYVFLYIAGLVAVVTAPGAEHEEPPPDRRARVAHERRSRPHTSIGAGRERMARLR
jgi:hypothetical protein